MPAETVIYAKDYRQPGFFIDKTFLRFELDEGVTRVHSRLLMRRNPQVQPSSLVLDGQNLELQCIKIDGKPIDAAHYRIDAEHLSVDLASDNDSFEFQCTTVIYPEKNTSLEGLYRSRGMYCTQCEAEGFRKITYYLDRPDVMSEFEVTLVADKYSFPAMLSNGNCISDRIEGDKREVIWHDPFKKPCYLFALVVGDLVSLEDVFVTQSGREVALKIYVEPKDLDKCDHAMQSLQKAMRWDEEVYGREYDLDIFMIVAVDDFNMGAMENKGLNIFNTSCVLASPATTTDDGFERVEAVVAHEYFHNWSGNRVTCRDWFQLSLKEGFTVFRDAEFSADMNSRDVKRIEDVILLRSVQFVEDAGPMAHPVRPDSYMEISNFYTVTIYEKGAEIVRMMANILGKDLFRKATDLYFERHDGQAVTCEDFVVCMEEASGIDLQQFRRWYSQAGTPLLKITDNYDADKQRYTLNVEQVLPVTPHAGIKQPFHIPLKLSLFGETGALALCPAHISLQESGNNTEVVLDVVSQLSQFHFDNVHEKPVPSLLRGFSAPVKLDYPYANEQLAHLIAVDTDGFARWDACQNMATKILRAMVDGQSAGEALELFIKSLRQLLQQDSIDNAMKALMLVLPGDGYIAELYDQADPVLIYNARQSMRKAIAVALREDLLLFYRQLAADVAGVSVEARSARSLRNMALSYLMLLDDAEVIGLCVRQFETSSTMTDQLAALKALVNCSVSSNEASVALMQFYRQWKDESLVVNMWLQVQASADSNGALDSVNVLLQHEAFDYRNPNKVRSLIGAFCNQNLLGFHDVSGKGYRFLAEQVMVIDKINPQIAARLVLPLTRWRRIEPVRSELMRSALQNIASMDLSSDVYEVVCKSLAI